MDEEAMKEAVYTKLGKYLCGKLIEHTGNLEGPCYNSRLDKDSKLWLAYPQNNIGFCTSSRVILISRETGEIVGDRTVGE